MKIREQKVVLDDARKELKPCLENPRSTIDAMKCLRSSVLVAINRNSDLIPPDVLQQYLRTCKRREAFLSKTCNERKNQNLKRKEKPPVALSKHTTKKELQNVSTVTQTRSLPSNDQNPQSTLEGFRIPKIRQPNPDIGTECPVVTNPVNESDPAFASTGSSAEMKAQEVDEEEPFEEIEERIENNPSIYIDLFSPASPEPVDSSHNIAEVAQTVATEFISQPESPEPHSPKDNGESETENVSMPSDKEESKEQSIDREKETKDVGHPMQELLIENEELDFEDDEDDDEDDDEGNFKRKRKEDSKEISETSASTNVKARLGVFDTGKELEKSIKTNLSASLTMANANPVSARIRITPPNSDRPKPQQNIQQNIKHNPVQQFSSEENATLEAIKNTNSPWDAFNLFVKTANRCNMKKPAFQQALQDIAIKAVACDFRHFPELGKKLADSDIVDNNFWNKLVTEAYTHMVQKTNNTGKLKHFLRCVYVYVSSKENIWLSAINFQRLLDAADLRICIDSTQAKPHPFSQESQMMGRNTMRCPKPPPPPPMIIAQQRPPFVGMCPPYVPPMGVQNMPPQFSVTLPHSTGFPNGHIVPQNTFSGTVTGLPQAPAATACSNERGCNIPEQTHQLINLFVSSRYAQINEKLLRNLDFNVPLAADYAEAFKNALKYDEDGVSFRLERAVDFEGSEARVSKTLSKNIDFSGIVIDAIQFCVVKKKYGDVTTILKLLDKKQIVLTTAKPQDLCVNLFLYCFAVPNQLSLVAKVVKAMSEFLNSSTPNTVHKPHLTGTEKDSFIDLMLKEALKNVKNVEATEMLLKSALYFYTNSCRPYEDLMQQCLFEYFKVLLNDNNPLPVALFYDFLSKNVFKKLDFHLSNNCMRALVAHFCNTESNNPHAKEMFDQALKQGVYALHYTSVDQDNFTMKIPKYLHCTEVREVVRRCLIDIYEKHISSETPSCRNLMMHVGFPDSNMPRQDTGILLLDESPISNESQLGTVLLKLKPFPQTGDNKVNIHLSLADFKVEYVEIIECVYKRSPDHATLTDFSAQCKDIPLEGPNDVDPRLAFMKEKLKASPPLKEIVPETIQAQEPCVQKIVSPAVSGMRTNVSNMKENTIVNDSANKTKTQDNEEDDDLLNAKVDSIDLASIVAKLDPSSGSRRVILPTPVESVKRPHPNDTTTFTKQTKRFKVIKRKKIPAKRPVIETS